MDALMTALRAAAEPTRLRILALCALGELTVSELVRILGQSQPRVSRHLRLLDQAGLLERFREGSWVLHRLAPEGPGAEFTHRLIDVLPADDATLGRDLARLAEVRRERAARAAAYFSAAAARWDRVRSLHVDDIEVERAITGLMPAEGIGDLLDIGTGTGRMLAVYGPGAARVQGIDLSREMLAVARANLAEAGLDNCAVRQADVHAMPFAPNSFDAVTIHQVLHFVDEPGRAIADAVRVLRPGGRVLVVDFAPHDLEALRIEHAHRRLGFADAEVAAWFADAGLETTAIRHLPGDPLTVGLWLAQRPAGEIPPLASAAGGWSDADAPERKELETLGGHTRGQNETT